MSHETLRLLYDSYVSRIRDFRTEQNAFVVFETTILALLIGRMTQLEPDALRSHATQLFIVVTAASTVLTAIYLNHSFGILRFARILGRIEHELGLPERLEFYRTTTKKRSYQYLVSLTHPVAVYCFSVLLFELVTEITVQALAIGLATHVIVFCSFGLAIHRKITKPYASSQPQDDPHND